MERLNPPLNAIVTLDAERALAEAAAADEAIARGEPLGPLHGLPITIEDTIETVGLRTTAGRRGRRAGQQGDARIRYTLNRLSAHVHTGVYCRYSPR